MIVVEQIIEAYKRGLEDGRKDGASQGMPYRDWQGQRRVGLGILPAILRSIRAGLLAGVRDEALRFRRVKRRDVALLAKDFTTGGTVAISLRRT